MLDSGFADCVDIFHRLAYGKNMFYHFCAYWYNFFTQAVFATPILSIYYIVMSFAKQVLDIFISSNTFEKEMMLW